jgi:hypothetical protein
MAKNYNMKAELGEYKVTSQDVRLLHTVRKKTIERDWPWIVLWLAITVAGIVAPLFISLAWGILLSTAVAVATFFIGLRMWREAVTITNELR